MTALRFHRELTPARFAQIGHPTAAFHSQDDRIVALCSEFPTLYWPGRSTYGGHRLQYRLSLYNRNLDRRMGAFDLARYPINDVAFHPSQPLLAIATGSYDGGYSFGGDLWLWNWESGECLSLLGESREVVQCRFIDENRLAVILERRFDDEFHRDDLYVGLIIDDFRDASEAGYRSNGFDPDPRLANLMPMRFKALEKELGFTDSFVLFSKQRQQCLEILRETGDYEERARVWDLLWLSDRQIGLVHDNCYLEIWNLEGKREYVQSGVGFGVQILDSPSKPLVHVLRRGNHLEGTETRSTLYRLTTKGLQALREFDRAVVLSTDKAGNLLCRETGCFSRKRKRMDRLMNPDLQEILSGDLGHYDGHNHYIRLDGGDGLYFLRGTPGSPHHNKKLCRIDPNGFVDTIMDWDGDLHLTNSIACWAPENTLIRAFYTYGREEPENRIQRCDLKTGQTLWTYSVTAMVTSMAIVGSSVLVYTLTDGFLGLLSIADGMPLEEECLTVDGISTVAMSLAVRGDRLAVGTIDGRLLLFLLSA